MCRENAFSLIAEIFVEACGARGGRGSGWGGHAGCCVTSHTAGAPRRAEGGKVTPRCPRTAYLGTRGRAGVRRDAVHGPRWHMAHGAVLGVSAAP